MAVEKFPGDELPESSKESADHHDKMQDKDIENELRKEKNAMDALRTEVVTNKQNELREGVDDAKNTELYDARKKIGKLRSEIGSIQQVKHTDYEMMSEDELADNADLGRADSVHTVSQLVEQTSFIPGWLKKSANS